MNRQNPLDNLVGQASAGGLIPRAEEPVRLRNFRHGYIEGGLERTPEE
jgi:hypothetical protein